MNNLLQATITTLTTDTSTRDQGVDISHHDPVLDPAKAVKRIGFVFMKLTEGTGFVDPELETMWKGVKQVDVRGGYHYQRSGFSWKLQADHFLKVASWFDLHVYVLDLEPENNKLDDTFFIDTRRIINYWREHAPVGKKIILYTNWDCYKQLYYALKRYYPDAEQWLADLELWYSWPSKLFTEPVLPPMRKTWTFWQKAWDGKPEEWGTTSFVDVNEFHGTHEELLAWAGITVTIPPIVDEPPVVVEPRVEPVPETDLWNAEVISGTRVVVRNYPAREMGTMTGFYVSTNEKFSGYIWAGNGYLWLKIATALRTELIGTWVAVRVLDGSGRLIELRKPVVFSGSGDIYRVMKWGDPVLVAEAGRTAGNLTTDSKSNFQAIGLYNKVSNTMGGVSNWLSIPHADVLRLRDLQRPDWALYSREQKMNWLCKPKGTIYFYGDMEGGWIGVPWLKWGTIALGNTLVQVEDLEMLVVKTPVGAKRWRKMARLAGFRSTDWARPLDELVANGLVHRCYCVYGTDDTLGDSPKGIVWSPFWSPEDWTFGGADGQPDALYIPFDWLIKP